MLWRFYVSDPEGGRTETLAIVEAETDSEATDRGFESLPEGRESSLILEYGIDESISKVDPDDVTQEDLADSGYFSATPITSLRDLEWALDDAPLIHAMKVRLESLARVIAPELPVDPPGEAADS